MRATWLRLLDEEEGCRGPVVTLDPDPAVRPDPRQGPGQHPLLSQGLQLPHPHPERGISLTAQSPPWNQPGCGESRCEPFSQVTGDRIWGSETRPVTTPDIHPIGWFVP